MIEVKNLYKSFDGREVLKNINTVFQHWSSRDEFSRLSVYSSADLTLLTEPFSITAGRR